MNLNFKPCMMTICMHDYAYPKRMVPLISALAHQSGNSNPTSVQIYTDTTIEGVRQMTDLELGRYVRVQLNKLDDHKKQIEG